MDINEINREIYALENGQTTYAACEKLSQLYVIRDHLLGNEESDIKEYSYAPAPMLDGSEFLITASGVDIGDLLLVLDEHMECVKVLYPREYEALMGKIRSLK